MCVLHSRIHGLEGASFSRRERKTISYGAGESEQVRKEK